jgi:chromosome segregation ATPase
MSIIGSPPLDSAREIGLFYQEKGIITQEDKETLQQGMAKYLIGPEVKEWYEERKNAFQEVATMRGKHREIQEQMSSTKQLLNTATHNLKEVEDRRQVIQSEEKEEETNFKTFSEQQRTEYDALKEKVDSEKRYSFLSFSNPLTTRIATMAATVGRYALAGSIALVSWLNQPVLESQCNHPFSSGPAGAIQCASTLLSSAILTPLAIGAGISFLSEQAKKIQERIQKRETKLARLQESLEQRQQQHDRKVAEITQKREELNSQSARNLETLEVGGKAIDQLEQKREEIHERLEGYRRNIAQEMVKRNLEVVKDTLKEEGSYAQKVGRSSIQNIFDALLMARAGVSQVHPLSLDTHSQAALK